MLVALGTAPGPGDQQCTVSIRARHAEETSGLSWHCLQKSGEMKEKKVHVSSRMEFYVVLPPPLPLIVDLIM